MNVHKAEAIGETPSGESRDYGQIGGSLPSTAWQCITPGRDINVYHFENLGTKLFHRASFSHNDVPESHEIFPSQSLGRIEIVALKGIAVEIWREKTREWRKTSQKRLFSSARYLR